MKKFIYPLFFIILFSACKEDDDTTKVINSKTFTVNASSKTDWVYFSFATGDTLKVADPANSTSWDLAFQRFNIRTNSGLSGKGVGGVYNTKKTGESEFSNLNKVPDAATFVTDDSVSTIGAMGKTVKVLANPALSDWYIYTEGSSTLLSNSYTYVIKTADGKYAKLMISSYYNQQGIAGYFTINYVYQPDGSKNLE
jgi:hypothetical protein